MPLPQQADELQVAAATLNLFRLLWQGTGASCDLMGAQLEL